VDVFGTLQWRSRGGGGASGGTRLVAQDLGAHQQAFYSHLNTRFEQKFRTNYTLKCVFFEKKTKNNLSVEGSAPDPLFASGGWWLHPQTPVILLPFTVTILSSSFLTLNAFYYPQKRAE